MSYSTYLSTEAAPRIADWKFVVASIFMALLLVVLFAAIWKEAFVAAGLLSIGTSPGVVWFVKMLLSKR